MSIIPDTVRDLLHQLRGDGDRTRWTIGDMTAERFALSAGARTQDHKFIQSSQVLA